TVTATADGKVYGDADPNDPLLFTATGFKNGEDQTVLTGELDRVDGENAGTYAINQGDLDGSNMVGPNSRAVDLIPIHHVQLVLDGAVGGAAVVLVLSRHPGVIELILRGDDLGFRFYGESGFIPLDQCIACFFIAGTLNRRR
ncbi:MAG: hypothetical protein IIB89_02285, partial [Chloroflexi bacterium]|nr:hypothetical protein [Chloroflexota bacterium]